MRQNQKKNLSEKNFSFLTIGDEKYFDSIIFSIKQIHTIYPGKKLFIYDWGFNEQQKNILRRKNNVVLVPWNRLFFDIDITFASLLQKMRVIYGVKNIRTFFSFLKKIRCLKDQYAKFIKRQMLFANKVFCFSHFMKEYEDNFVFLDGDACVINRFDELFTDDFDIGVTLRRKSEISLEFGDCKALNSGVIFFFGGANKNKRFIELWVGKMLSTKEPWIEQTALSRMLLDVDSNVFDGYYKEVVLGNDEKIKVKVLPCEIYNYNWIEEGFNPKIQKILHFKGGRHAKEIFDEIITKLHENYR